MVEKRVHGADGPRLVRLGEDVREEWRADLDPKIRAVRELAVKYGAELLEADGLFARLAESWLRLVA